MSTQHARIFELSSKRRALLEELLQEEGVERACTPVIPRRTNNDPAPLSFAQQRLWFLDQLDPGGSAYNIPWAIRLEGCLNVEVLRQALAEIIARHEIVRTTFGVTSEGLRQVIAPVLNIPLPIINIEALGSAERETEVQRLVLQEAQQGFDLTIGPLLRTTLLRLREDDKVLLLTIHHIISDGWSAGVILQELGALYEAFAAGQQSPLADLPIQYADYAVWQRERLRGEVLDEQLAYWRCQLAGASLVLNLPTDHPRPVVRRVRGARESLSLTAPLTEQLKSLSRDEGVTLY